MAKLIFRYGAMGSSKTANALMVRYNYDEKGKRVVLLKPKFENRDGDKTIRSRIGIEYECEFVEDFIQYEKENWSTIKMPEAIIVDEAQFLTKEQVEILSGYVDNDDVTVICYGLRTDFQSNLFEGSKRLMELADEIEEIKTICWCGKRAQFNARIVDGKMTLEGDQVQLGGNECYAALCRKHYRLQRIAPDNWM